MQSKRLRSLYSKSRGSKDCGEGTLEPRGLSRDFWICSLTLEKQGGDGWATKSTNGKLRREKKKSEGVDIGSVKLVRNTGLLTRD